MGGLIKIFPLAYVFIFIGSLALTGIPFFTGFYSKDAILEIAFARYSFSGNFAYILGCSAAFCTAFYSCRLIFLAFINSPNSFKVYKTSAHEPSLKMLVPLFLLGFGSIFAGFFFKEFFIGLGTPFFNNSIFVLFTPVSLDGEFLNPFVKNIPLFVTLLGFLSSFLFIYGWPLSNFLILQFKLSFFFRNVYAFLSKKWHFDQIINTYLVHFGMLFGYNVSFQLLDKGNIEKYGPSGFSKSFGSFSNVSSWLHSGYVFHYMLIFMSFIIGALLFSFFYCFDTSFSFHTIFYLLVFSYCGFFSANHFQS